MTKPVFADPSGVRVLAAQWGVRGVVALTGLLVAAVAVVLQVRVPLPSLDRVGGGDDRAPLPIAAPVTQPVPRVVRDRILPATAAAGAAGGGAGLAGVPDTDGRGVAAPPPSRTDDAMSKPRSDRPTRVPRRGAAAPAPPGSAPGAPTAKPKAKGSPRAAKPRNPRAAVPGDPRSQRPSQHPTPKGKGKGLSKRSSGDAAGAATSG